MESGGAHSACAVCGSWPAEVAPGVARLGRGSAAGRGARAEARPASASAAGALRRGNCSAAVRLRPGSGSAAAQQRDGGRGRRRGRPAPRQLVPCGAATARQLFGCGRAAARPRLSSGTGGEGGGEAGQCLGSWWPAARPLLGSGSAVAAQQLGCGLAAGQRLGSAAEPSAGERDRQPYKVRSKDRMGRAVWRETQEDNELDKVQNTKV